MTRVEAIKRIGTILDKRCAVCQTRDELNRMHKTVFSRIDGYCNRECVVGKELQSLGRHLKRGERRNAPIC